MWASVQRGERKHIFPFQNSADAAFNSALDYELGGVENLRGARAPLRETHGPGICGSGAPFVLPVKLRAHPAQFVPGNSILREFIGESEFKY
jgi:uridine kinase